MSLQVLPVELLDNIAQNLDSHSLASFAQTCSSFSALAQRLLYRHLSVSAWSRNLCVVANLAAKPDVAAFVRSFAIAIDPSAPVFSAFYRLLAKAIVNMSGLVSLNLKVDADLSWILHDPSRRVLYAHMVQFTCPFALDHHVAAFLGKTPSLSELGVDSMPFTRSAPLPSLPIDVIPHLAQLVGSSRTARVIVPGRPLQSIHLIDGGLTEDDIRHLAQSSARVVVLGAMTGMSPVPFLESLHRHMPRLVYLRIMSTQNLLNAPASGFYGQVANALAPFTDLTAFELSGMHWGSHTKNNDEGYQRVWQSTPLSSGIHREDHVPFDTEMVLY